MRVKIVFAIAGFVLLGGNETLAQIYSYAEEALTISRFQPGGSARVRGMGGVQNALGGDISSAYYNPAGLGMYNRSEFSITPGFVSSNTSASYLNNASSASTSNFIIPNIGIAFHTDKGSKGLLGGTFAINFNRINDFNNSFNYHGTNKDNSIIDYFINTANGQDSTQFSSGHNGTPQGSNYNSPVGLAYNNYLIGPKSDFNASFPKDQYFSYVPLQDILQDETVKTSGSQNQWSFSYGVNLNDKIFLGGGLGLASFKYKTTTTYNETYTKDPVHSMQLVETLEQGGSGINATLGIIARPVEQVQLGFSVATPTAYQITDNYSASMSSSWNNFQYYPGQYLNNLSEKTDVVTTNYNLATPWRISGGFAFFIQKHGFISADAEWVNYSNSKYTSNTTGVSYSDDNTTIQGLYKSVINLRVGGEYRLGNYRFRGGYSLMPDPFQSTQNGESRSLSSYSIGAGYRITAFYLDAAFILGQGNTTHRPYPYTDPVALKNTTTSFVVTVGFPF